MKSFLLNSLMYFIAITIFIFLLETLAGGPIRQHIIGTLFMSLMLGRLKKIKDKRESEQQYLMMNEWERKRHDAIKNKWKH